MPQYQDFGFQPPPRLEAAARHAGEQEANCNHAMTMLRFATDCESTGRNFRKRQYCYAPDNWLDRLLHVLEDPEPLVTSAVSIIGKH